MSKQTKLILSVIGVAAVLVPALLLIITTSRTQETPSVPTEDRQIDPKNINDTVTKLTPSQPPASASSSASPSIAPFKTKESTGSGVSK